MRPMMGFDQAEFTSEAAFSCRRELKNGRTSGYNLYPAAELKRANRSGTSDSGRPFSELKGRNVV